MVNIIGVGGKISNSGYGTSAILTEFSEPSSSDNITDVEYINITTSYPNAWHLFLNWILEEGGCSSSYDYDTNFTNNRVTIHFSGSQKPTVHLKIMDILAQIGPGWIE